MDDEWVFYVIENTPDGAATYRDGRRLSPDEAREHGILVKDGSVTVAPMTPSTHEDDAPTM